MANIDEKEVEHFSNLSQEWWDLNGPLRTLHQINPSRMEYIQSQTELKNKTILDLGCGGGILSESLSECGAKVTGVDASAEAIEIAKSHLSISNNTVDYLVTTAEDFALLHPEKFDIITCMEMLEHVPDPASIIEACSKLLKPNGLVFFSTINRNVKSLIKAIIGAEYILELLPKGTHDYDKFIRPSEMVNIAKTFSLTALDMAGIDYDLVKKVFSLTRTVDVNYMVVFRKD